MLNPIHSLNVVTASSVGGRELIPGQVILKTLKMVLMAALLGALSEGCGVGITTDWLVSG